jgi:hypothetical protein
MQRPPRNCAAAFPEPLQSPAHPRLRAPRICAPTTEMDRVGDRGLEVGKTVLRAVEVRIYSRCLRWVTARRMRAQPPALRRATASQPCDARGGARCGCTEPYIDCRFSCSMPAVRQCRLCRVELRRWRAHALAARPCPHRAGLLRFPHERRERRRRHRPGAVHLPDLFHHLHSLPDPGVLRRRAGFLRDAVRPDCGHRCERDLDHLLAGQRRQPRRLPLGEAPSPVPLSLAPAALRLHFTRASGPCSLLSLAPSCAPSPRLGFPLDPRRWPLATPQACWLIWYKSGDSYRTSCPVWRTAEAFSWISWLIWIVSIILPSVQLCNARRASGGELGWRGGGGTLCLPVSARALAEQAARPGACVGRLQRARQPLARWPQAAASS